MELSRLNVVFVNLRFHPKTLHDSLLKLDKMQKKVQRELTSISTRLDYLLYPLFCKLTWKICNHDCTTSGPAVSTMWRLVDSITVAQTLVAVVSEIVEKRRILIYNLNLFRKDIFKKSILKDCVQDDHFRIQPSVLMPLLKSKELYPHVLPS